MIPLLSPIPDRRLMVARPVGFRPVVGVPQVRSIVRSDYARALGMTTAQKAGLAYESRVQRALIEKYCGVDQYWAAPHIHFKDNTGFRTCMPDGILTLDGVKYVLEIKKPHCAMAWWQLERLYRPLVRSYYHTFEVRVCAITRSFDPAVAFPVEPVRIKEIDDLPSLSKYDCGVLVWRL